MTDPLLSPGNTVADIAAKLPGAARIFREAGISFCCGGDLSLSQAADKAGLDLAALTARLQGLIDKASRDAPSDTPALIQHIIDRYHVTHREELDFLIPLANRVEIVHGDHDDAPLGLTQALIALRDGLEAQMTAQENLLFPAILQGEVAGLAGHVRTVIDQHDEIGTILQRIEHVTRSMQLPIGACGSWTALYTGLRKLCADVVAHFYVEQSLLLPRAVAA